MSDSQLPAPGQPGPPRPPAFLVAIGYWSGPHTEPSYPDVSGFIDETWNERDREVVSFYLRAGVVAAACMGYSTCRICGRINNGSLDLTDGFFVWPEGLAHYVDEHAVRLPEPFVQHVYAWDDALSDANAARQKAWWTSHLTWNTQSST